MTHTITLTDDQYNTLVVALMHATGAAEDDAAADPCAAEWLAEVSALGDEIVRQCDDPDYLACLNAAGCIG